MHLGVIAPQKF